MTVSINYRETSQEPKVQMTAKVDGAEDAVWETIVYKGEVAVALRDKKNKNVHIEFFNDNPEKFAYQRKLRNWYLLQFCQDCMNPKDVAAILDN